MGKYDRAERIASYLIESEEVGPPDMGQDWRKLYIAFAQNDCSQDNIMTSNLWKSVHEWEKPWLYFDLAECLYSSGHFERAIALLQESQQIYTNFVGFRAVYYPKSFYLLGKIYEASGKTSLAVANYQKFLKIWQHADNDLPELIEARHRLANLTKSPIPSHE